MFALNTEGNLEGSVKIQNTEKGCLGFRMKIRSSGSPTYMISSGGVGVLRPRTEKIVKVTVPAQIVFGKNLWCLTQTPQIFQNLWCLEFGFHTPKKNLKSHSAAPREILNSSVVFEPNSKFHSYTKSF